MLEKSYFRNKLFRKIDLYQYQYRNCISQQILISSHQPYFKIILAFYFFNNLLDITAC
jgi:hypothetical protein